MFCVCGCCEECLYFEYAHECTRWRVCDDCVYADDGCGMCAFVLRIACCVVRLMLLCYDRVHIDLLMRCAV